MTCRVHVSQAQVTRVVRGALAAGLPMGSFTVEVGDGIIRLLPTMPGVALPSAESAAEDAWDKALGLQ